MNDVTSPAGSTEPEAAIGEPGRDPSGDPGDRRQDVRGDFSVVAAIDALDAATRAIAGELDLDRVLQLIVDSVRMLVQSRYAALGIVDKSGRIEHFITSGISTEQRAKIGTVPRGHGLLGLIIREGRSFRIPEISKHRSAYGFPPHHPPMHSFLGVPVRAGGQPLGNFYLTEKRGSKEFTEQDQRLVEMFALHAGIAIQNARLHARVRRLAVIDERIRIGRDLHDGIIQGIYAVALSLEDVPDLMAGSPAEATMRVDRAIDRLNVTISEIRTFILELGSDAGQADVGQRLSSIIDEAGMTSAGKVAIRLELEPGAVSALDNTLAPEAANQLLQIVREALSNTIRHSGARAARVVLRVRDGVGHLLIEDDGRGFDTDLPRGAGHFGLANLHDRAASMGGTLEIRSAIGSGTRIIATFPLSPSEVAS